MTPLRYWRFCLVTLGCGGLFALAGAWTAQLKPSEVLLFYPTYAAADGDFWQFEVHGCVFDPEVDSLIRHESLEAFARLIGLKPEDAAKPIFEQRARAFLVDHKGDKCIAIRVGETELAAGVSGANGHFQQTIRINKAGVERLAGQGAWLTLPAVLGKSDQRAFTCRCRLIEPEGLSIISDIDDTIKISEVRDKHALMARTFLREFEPVPGMPELYQAWEKQGAVVHYVSASPWQLYEPLDAFITKHRFPAGTFHLKQFRLKDTTALSLLESPEKAKPPLIEPILQAFPKRRFILVGDSGEKDPEIYGELARKHPEQITRVVIRNVTHEPADAERYSKAFKDVPREKWQVFAEAREVKP
jgi:phosphatidate phosphatase APP1